MIQELLSGAGATLIAGERNYSSSTINGGGGGALLQTTQSPNSSTTTITTTTTTSTPTTATATSSENQQNLRCPRCDSSNTKFCYYNNYNLTQPRHFCKTCRRYWTKGGALRNVPIGGGCRKNKNFGVSSSSSAAKTTATKLKTVASSEFINGRSGISLGHGFDVEHVLPPPPPSQILWGSPQNSHLLAFLRSSQNQNQSPNPNLKEEGNLMESQSQPQPHMMTEPPLLNHRTPSSYDGVGHVICNSFWRNNHDQHQPQQQNGGFLHGEQQHQNSGIQELYQKLRLSSGNNNNYCSESLSPVFLGNNVASSSSSSMSNILEPTSVAGGELGYWNIPTLSWSDLPTTNGAAYP